MRPRQKQSPPTCWWSGGLCLLLLLLVSTRYIWDCTPDNTLWPNSPWLPYQNMTSPFMGLTAALPLWYCVFITDVVMVSLTSHDLNPKAMARYAELLPHYIFETSWVPIDKLSLSVCTCSTSSVLTNCCFYIANLHAVTNPYVPLLLSSLSSPFVPRPVT